MPRSATPTPSSGTCSNAVRASRRLETGISIVPYADAFERGRELVRIADEAGLEYVGIQDHPYQARFLDTFALIATLLAETNRISFFTDVANLPLRGPAMIAKAFASLDVLSGGRVELGLGAGAFLEQAASMGGPRRSRRESVDALEEAIEVIRLLWSGERVVSFEGRYYRLEDAHPGPRPTRAIGIWLGAFGPRMQGLTGRKADGWLPSLGMLSKDELRAGNERIDAAADDAGREPRQVRRVLNLQGLIGEARTPPEGRLPVGYLAGDPLAGPPAWWAEMLIGFAEDGFDTLVFWPIDPSPEQVELFAGEVVPSLREIPGLRTSP
jgi:alkanesulfonate monooxygenase SsuD/methylene tetrahydromethanopterin reductase-like flavin-dependent oxidoreductase (luciferase family)